MSIRRLIYTPSGKAGEYAKKGYAANIFKGCKHGCKYCYVPSFLKMNAEEKALFESTVTPVPNLMERLEKDLKRLGELPVPIFLCFTCDPYPENWEMRNITRKVITTIMASGNAVNILTKGGTRSYRDMPILCRDKRNKLGVTLTFHSDDLSEEWEPGAALPFDRINMLKAAKMHGISTWASIEPVIVPSESLRIMEFALPYVDKFKIGKWNYASAAKEIDWRRFAEDAIDLMEKNGKRYMLKDDLRKCL
jgi:DNA repair photolyase